jgi:hypothetical protein
MRFGGHETFWIREGWLHKGLKLLIEKPDLLVDEYAADWLGVGRNMAKSIRHWMVATGLAERPAPGKNACLQATEFGSLVYDRDAYFSEIGTWWMLHVNLINAPTHAASWHWFFNNFTLSRFEKSQCEEGLCQHLQLSESRLPSPRTLERDIACLLSSYARPIPGQHEDPEEARDCPFTELGLMSYFRDSGYYQLHQVEKKIPTRVFGYALSKGFESAAEGDGMIDIPLHEVARQPGGPGRAFALTSEALFEVILAVEDMASTGDIQIAGLAGNRVVRIHKKAPLEWAEDYYRKIE